MIIDPFKLTIGLLVALALVYGAYSIHHHGYKQGLAEKQIEFDAYKADIDKQVTKAKADALRIKTEQDAKYEKAKSDYRRDTTILTERLRDYSGVLCGEGQNALRVDERGESAMPTKADSTTGAIEAVKTTTRPRPTFLYVDAIMDAQQCSALIQFVKAM